MLAMIRLSSGTGGTTVVGDGINVGHWNVGDELVPVGSGDIVGVGVEGDTVGTESATPNAQAGKPDIISITRSNPGLKLNMKRPSFQYTFEAGWVPE